MTLQFARTLSILALAFAPAISAHAAPKKEAGAGKPIIVEGDLKPFGNPNAPQGGTINVNLGGEPSTLHPITSSDGYSSSVRAYVFDSLLTRNPDTYEFMPALADRAEISADGKTFTFHIRTGAKWHDGKPLTAEDVKFSFDAIFEPKYNAANLIPYYENIEKAEIIDPQTVKFTVKEKYFRNLDSVAGLTVIPKHIYSDPETSKKMNKTILGSGPYKFEKYEQGQNITLVRNKEWWGNNVSQFKGQYNFERIRFRFIKDENIGIEMVKKGELDYMDTPALSPEGFMKFAQGPEWGKTVMKAKVENLAPKSYGYIGWNNRNPIFSDKEVRLALYQLMNRKEMNSKFRFDLSLPATGPWYQQSEYADKSVKPVEFDAKKAAAALKKAGWTDTDKDGILDKMIDGKKVDFRFTLTYGRKDNEKYYVLYQGDLKKAGIDMQLQLLEWNSLVKSLDDARFDAIAMSWTAGGVDVDPKQVWHSASVAKGGSNFIAYKNPEVDKLIEAARVELDKSKRIPMLKKVYKAIAEEAPYAFMFNDKYILYIHTPRMKMAKPTMKYDIGVDYWWADGGK